MSPIDLWLKLHYKLEYRETLLICQYDNLGQTRTRQNYAEGRQRSACDRVTLCWGSLRSHGRPIANLADVGRIQATSTVFGGALHGPEVLYEFRLWHVSGDFETLLPDCVLLALLVVKPDLPD